MKPYQINKRQIMTEEQKDLIKNFIEDHWTFFEQHVQKQLQDEGNDGQAADDVALKAIEDLERV